MSKSIEVSAKTQEEAVSKGLEELGASISEVTIEIIQEGSKGLFGLFGSRLAKVRLTLKDDVDADEAQKIVSDMFRSDEDKPQPKKEKPRRVDKQPEAAVEEPQPKEAKPKAESPKAVTKKAEEKPQKAASAEPKKEKKPVPQRVKTVSKPRQEARKASAEEDDAAKTDKKIVQSPEEIARSIELTRSFLTDLTRLMGVEVTMEVTADEEGTVKADMQGDSLGILIGRRGETLDALQYLTSLWVNKDRDQYTRVTLDSEHYRAKREEALIRLANRMANRVQRTGRRVSMEAMNPYERRIMHSALQSNNAVYTHSEGEGLNRHVVISPKKADKNPEA